jgi:hypothetical protein
MVGLLPSDNPLSQWVAPRRNALMGFSAGMLSGSPSTAMVNAMKGGQIDQEYTQQAAQQEQAEQSKNATLEWLRTKGYDDLVAGVEGGGLDMQTAWGEALRRGQPQTPGENLMSVGGHLYDKASGQWISPPDGGNGGTPRVSLAGQWGRDQQGNPVYLQPSDSGEMIPAQVPEGVTLMGPFDINADRAAGSTWGKGIGGAQLDLPNAELIGQQTISAINDVRNETKGMEEHFGNVLGVPQQMTPAWPGSPKARFQVAADRAINRAFLEGREMLKGAGQITDFESRKAEAAITAAQAAMEKGDKAQFLKALDDFEQAVRDGLAKMQAQAGQMQGYGQQGQQQSPNTTSSGLQWSIEP